MISSGFETVAPTHEDGPRVQNLLFFRVLHTQESQEIAYSQEIPEEIIEASWRGQQ